MDTYSFFAGKNHWGLLQKWESSAIINTWTDKYFHSAGKKTKLNRFQKAILSYVIQAAYGGVLQFRTDNFILQIQIISGICPCF